MNYSKGTIEFHIEGSTAVSLGKFDGLHKGHQLLIRRILEKKKEGLSAVIFTFDFGRSQELMSGEERRSMLEQWGVDYLLECPFVPEVSHMEPEDFVRRVLKGQLHAKYLAVGTDFRFGYQRRGDYKLLQDMALECGFIVDVVEKAKWNQRDISSTFIREMLGEGNMPLVRELLGYPYSITGTVVHGRAMGRGLGMPTINLLPDERKLLPPNGVYAVKCLVDGKCYRGITNIGFKPTVGGETVRGVETYLLDVDENLYEKEVTLYFYAFERPEQKFGSLEELKEQMQMDVAWVRNWFENAGEDLQDDVTGAK